MMVLSWLNYLGRVCADLINQYRFGSQKPVKDAIVLGPTDTVKVSLTTTEGDQAKRPHQAFLILNEETGLEAPFPLKMKASGKGTVDFVCISCS